MAANPKVSFVFDGTTSDAPAYNNVVGFAPSDTSLAATYPLSGSHTTAFHVVLASNHHWDWEDCQPPDDPCDRYESKGGYDVLDVVTHEWGHVLGLDHVPDRQLTMNDMPEVEFGSLSRRRATLGLGDVLGLRKLYPCDCPMPMLYSP